MINILQNNAYNNTVKLSYSREDIYKILFYILCDDNSNNSNNNESRFNKKCNYFLETYNIEKKDFFLRFFFFLIKQKIKNINKFLVFYEVLLKTNLYSSKFNVFFYKNVKKYI